MSLTPVQGEEKILGGSLVSQLRQNSELQVQRETLPFKKIWKIWKKIVAIKPLISIQARVPAHLSI